MGGWEHGQVGAWVGGSMGRWEHVRVGVWLGWVHGRCGCGGAWGLGWVHGGCGCGSMGAGVGAWGVWLEWQDGAVVKQEFPGYCKVH